MIEGNKCQSLCESSEKEKKFTKLIQKNFGLLNLMMHVPIRDVIISMID